MDTPRTLLIACGALAREIAALTRANGWTSFDVRCLPAELHNRPEKIAPAVREEIRAQRAHYQHDVRRVRRLRHRRDAGRGAEARKASSAFPARTATSSSPPPQVFAQLSEAELGTFYLTDFLLRHFERLVVRALGLDRHPAAAPGILPPLQQARLPRPGRIPGRHRARARRSPSRFGFEFEYRFTGYGDLGSRLAALAASPAEPQMASLIIISWRDIPAQVVVKRGRETAKVQLSASASRKRSTGRRCAPARAAPMPTLPTGSAAIRRPAARTCRRKPPRRPRASRRASPMSSSRR